MVKTFFYNKLYWHKLFFYPTVNKMFSIYIKNRNRYIRQVLYDTQFPAVLSTINCYKILK